MRSVASLIVFTSCSAILGGCANFDTIRTFAKDGSTVAAAAKKDVDVFLTSCNELKAEEIVLAYARGKDSVGAGQSPTCKAVISSAQVTAESLSVQLLIKYHEALNALAGNENWSLSKEIEGLGAAVKGVKVDGKAFVSASDVDKYQGAFKAIADLLVSALREREARRLLKQEFDWQTVLRPLRFWYGGLDGKSVSLYSQACRIIRTDWSVVQSQLLDYARCDRAKTKGVMACEPLTAGARLAAIDVKLKPIMACAPAQGGAIPDAALARVRLIDGWIEANEELRRKAFEKDIQVLLTRLVALREQVIAINKAFE
jgi:hypothetical protein